jgi:hypothetical protein
LKGVDGRILVDGGALGRRLLNTLFDFFLIHGVSPVWVDAPVVPNGESRLLFIGPTNGPVLCQTHRRPYVILDDFSVGMGKTEACRAETRHLSYIQIIPTENSGNLLECL